MNKAWKLLSGPILEGASPDAVSTTDIDNLVKEFPYFTALHYLKAAKFDGDGSDLAIAARSRAAIYFQNTHWFKAILDDEEEVAVHPGTLAETFTTPVEEVIPENTEPDHTEMVVEEAEQDYDDKRVEPSQEPAWENALAENPVYLAQSRSDEETFEQDTWNHQVEEQDTSVEAAAVEEQPAPEVQDQPAEATAEPVPAAPVAETETVIPIEPLYTIDYFASQGIRYNLDAGKDQLSLKLKSFTEWLKSMKRIHPEKVEQGMAKDDEATVRENAETSNETQEVYTEAMAEVFLKQGMQERAIEIYRKLSLLDPSKSAYFAVRIKEIKEN